MAAITASAIAGSVASIATITAVTASDSALVGAAASSSGTTGATLAACATVGLVRCTVSTCATVTSGAAGNFTAGLVVCLTSGTGTACAALAAVLAGAGAAALTTHTTGDRTTICRLTDGRGAGSAGAACTALALRVIVALSTSSAGDGALVVHGDIAVYTRATVTAGGIVLCASSTLSTLDGHTLIHSDFTHYSIGATVHAWCTIFHALARVAVTAKDSASSRIANNIQLGTRMLCATVLHKVQTRLCGGSCCGVVAFDGLAIQVENRVLPGIRHSNRFLEALLHIDPIVARALVPSDRHVGILSLLVYIRVDILIHDHIRCCRSIADELLRNLLGVHQRGPNLHLFLAALDRVSFALL